jgi:pyocin large subunit-like protein
VCAAIGFEDASSRADHYERHGAEFGITSEFDYEQAARDFLNGPIGATILRCVRQGNGDIIRYDIITHAFAVMRSDGIVKTFYKPRVSWHRYSSNVAYFQAECKK